MRERPIDVAGYVVNGLSIALYFLLPSLLDIPISPPVITSLALMLVAIGACLVALSISALVRNRGGGLIDRGVFSVVRHPMYLGAMLLFSSFAFFRPHWLMVLISVVNIAIVYGFIVQGEHQSAIKFGTAYTQYMRSVPRINLLAGILRRLQRKSPQS